MVNYRRSRTPGATYFFTVNLRDRSARHLVTHIDHLRNSFRDIQLKRPFKIDAIVILPDHLHMIMKLPDGDHDFPGRWKAIKSHFSRTLMKEEMALTRNKKGEINLWQRRYWEHQIRDESDLRNHMDYIHFNPVKHGHVKSVMDWPYSSFHRYVQSGLLERSWGSDELICSDCGFGERFAMSYLNCQILAMSVIAEIVSTSRVHHFMRWP